MTKPSGASLGMKEKKKEENGITLTNPSWGCVNSKCKELIKLWGWPELEKYIAYRSSNATPHQVKSEIEILNAKQISLWILTNFWNHNKAVKLSHKTKEQSMNVKLKQILKKREEKIKVPSNYERW